MNKRRAVMVVITLVLANFLWQSFTGQNWHAAMERSYFQAFAILVAYFFT
jgi:hypothetical protein